MCIPAFEGRYSDIYIFKTPHHPDFKKDAFESMVTVASATAAAPTFFRPLDEGGYTFVDGGIWANNPVMIALVEAPTSFDVAHERVRILSLGCGDDPYVVSRPMIEWGGFWYWRKIVYGAMRLQSLKAVGQAGLLIGADSVVRIDAPTSEQKIEMDDWVRARAELPPEAERALDHWGERIAALLLQRPAAPYEPLIKP